VNNELESTWKEAPSVVLEVLKKVTENLKIICVPAEIRAEDLQITTRKHYCDIQQTSLVVITVIIVVGLNGNYNVRSTYKKLKQ
jgi:hypothetical protein